MLLNCIIQCNILFLRIFNSWVSKDIVILCNDFFGQLAVRETLFLDYKSQITIGLNYLLGINRLIHIYQFAIIIRSADCLPLSVCKQCFTTLFIFFNLNPFFLYKLSILVSHNDISSFCRSIRIQYQLVYVRLPLKYLQACLKHMTFLLFLLSSVINKSISS